MSKVYYMVIVLFVTGMLFSCTDTTTKKTTAKTSKKTNTSTTTKNKEKKLTDRSTPESIGKLVLQSFKNYDFEQFRDVFVSNKHRADVETMIRSVNLNEEELNNSMDVLNSSMAFWSDNNYSSIKKGYNSIYSYGKELGVDWNNVKLKNVKNQVVSVQDFGLNINVQDIYITFVSNNKEHQIQIPKCFDLKSGHLVGEAKIVY